MAISVPMGVPMFLLGALALGMPATSSNFPPRPC
jgi:hypothetical protein